MGHPEKPDDVSSENPTHRVGHSSGAADDVDSENPTHRVGHPENRTPRVGCRGVADRYRLDEAHATFNFRYEMRMYRQLSSAVRLLKMVQAGWEPSTGSM